MFCRPTTRRRRRAPAAGLPGGAVQILRDGAGTGQFLSETGGTHPW